MSISSSLAAGVSGLNANAQRLASISDNIANSSTFGYKRSFTDFNALVTNSGNASRFTAGGVSSSTLRMVDERGQIQASSNATDIAINGRGFLPVANYTSAISGDPFKTALATTGSFRPNAAGHLVDSAGNALLGWPASLDGSFPSFPRDAVDGLVPINIFHNQFAANPTDQMSVQLNLPSVDSDPTSLGGPHDIALEYFGNQGQTHILNFEFTPTGTDNEWTVQITDSDSGGAVIGEYTMEFSDSPTGGGTLASVTTVSGGVYVPSYGIIPLTTGSGGMIDIDIGRLGEAGGITQLDSGFSPSLLSKNGSPVGILQGVEIDEGGIIQAIYDSGFTRPIYQVPVIDVANPNGLVPGDGQSFGISLESGSIFLWDAGQGPVGETLGFAREASSVDVAQELTQLIQTQRAYSSNAKIIQTVDEMLQETTNLKR
ncbi:Flagellar hook protein FlgE [Rhodobacteraceae bacterium THAF1]|uniref:flagellar hook protein FlgE n=1 Tax=Palleronia sp. THAF1 TaxID=2587842 RepID=UPI000F419A8B|nr:flagellar hook-basal body complex protein [Palleronia sp. THAF1]QFU10227.1 Flagellar hook protein FlgE [Palleronia sp. THAF1]VDC16868.1 Flagellar hook protein FlgE [Rhodobacteraceae bacterium THAF1]